MRPVPSDEGLLFRGHQEIDSNLRSYQANNDQKVDDELQRGLVLVDTSER